MRRDPSQNLVASCQRQCSEDHLRKQTQVQMTSELRILLTDHIDFVFGVEWLRLATVDERALSVDLSLLLGDFLA